MTHTIVTFAFAFAIVLGGVFAWSAWLNQAFAFLNKQSKRLTNLKSHFVECNAMADDLLVGLEETPSLPPLDHKNPTDEFVYNLSSQARAGLAQVDVASALDELADVLSERVSWARFYATFAVYFGLIGTITGLYLALNNIEGVTQIRDVAALPSFARSIQDLLGSLQGAFMSAGAGVLGTVVIGGMLHRFDSRCTEHLAELNQLAHRHILPFLETQRLGRLPTTSVEAAQALVKQLDKTLTTFTRAWADRFHSLADETGRLSEAAERLTESSKALEATSDSMAESSAGLGETLDHLANVVDSNAKALNEARALVESASNSVGELARTATGWPDISDQLEKTGDQVVVAASKMEDAASILGRTSVDLEKVLTAISEHVTDISEESYNDLSERLANALAQVVASASDEIRQIRTASESRDQRIEEMVRSIEETVTQQDGYLHQITALMGQIYSLVPVLKDPGPTLQEIVENLRRVSGAIDTASRRLEQVVEPGLVTDGETPVDSESVRRELERISGQLGDYRALRESANRKLDLIFQAIQSDGPRGPTAPSEPLKPTQTSTDGDSGEVKRKGIFWRIRGGKSE